jgi:DNA-directed RNA polymerase subunit L
MDLHVISEKKNEMEFELKGEDATFSSLLVNQLLKDKNVEVAQYNISHPLVGEPTFYVKTKSGKPRTVVLKAVHDIKSSLTKLKK